MPGGVTYGKDYVPWGSFVVMGDGSAAGGAGALGAWVQINASTTYAAYPLTVTTGLDTTPVGFEVGYGPVGAERAVAAGLTRIPLPSTDLIPEGSRLVVRHAGANSATNRTAVSGLRADKWGPDPTVIGPKHQSVTPKLSSITATTAGVTIVDPLLYPFVLTTVYAAGLTGTLATTVSVRAGRSGTEVPIVEFSIARPDGTGAGIFNFTPRPLPIAAGTRLSGWTSSGTVALIIAGYRLDY